MSNKRINKAYIRYDGNGRVIPGALLLNRFKPTGGGKWHEIPAYECCNPTPVLALKLLFDDIANANLLVGDASNVADWNTFFDLPTNGNPFTSVVISGNEVQLYGGSNIIVADFLFTAGGGTEDQTYLLSVDDTAGSIVEVGKSSFLFNINLTYVNLPNCLAIRYDEINERGSFEYNILLETVLLPNVITLEDASFFNCWSLLSISAPNVVTLGGFGLYGVFVNCEVLPSVSFPLATYVEQTNFENCYLLTSINLSSCTNLGPTVTDDSVFNSIYGNNITLTIPAALMTANAGNPDGDIVYLQANNTVTIITI